MQRIHLIRTKTFLTTRITTNVFCYFPVNEFNLSILEAIERETNVPFLKSVSDITQGSGFRKGAIRKRKPFIDHHQFVFDCPHIWTREQDLTQR